ncbi:hypothetical protein [Sphingorhabdus sp. 109]|uniref:hypothetical protein n=1 Tax=Sphingorhabdus sp. 109 TaxID=2653173 RepID=UPI0012F253C6|nr:hypothetical protein [Sphingorhabdus sp. 109]VWX62582.1 conserved hypothetical protein [Sphingorhabdus sp. 109]
MAGLMEGVDLSIRVTAGSGTFRRGGFGFSVVATVLAASALTVGACSAILQEEQLQVELGDGEQFLMLNAEQRADIAEVLSDVDADAPMDQVDLASLLSAIGFEAPPEQGGDDDASGGDNSEPGQTNPPPAGAQSGSADTGGGDVTTTASTGADSAGATPTPSAPSPAPSAKVETTIAPPAKSASKPAAKRAPKKSAKPSAKAAD